MPFCAAEIFAAIRRPFWQTSILVAFAFRTDKPWIAFANMTIILCSYKAGTMTGACLLVTRVVLTVTSGVTIFAPASVAAVAVYAVSVVV